ncbi:MAG TPA: cytochrome c3 family protein [Blastocatellia bacterium]|nr:cytochrome c3 family protein [Blastocatellia bacterium]
MKLITLVLFVIASCLAVAFAAPVHRPMYRTVDDAPKGVIVLGDPSVSPAFGHDKKWGPVKNFDHGKHSQASYASSCEQCHHTNKDAKSEPVKKCTECHKEEGNDKNPSTKSGDEANVQDAFHGNPNNDTNSAGCIECHKKMKKGPTNCADCHEKKG